MVKALADLAIPSFLDPHPRIQFGVDRDELPVVHLFFNVVGDQDVAAAARFLIDGSMAVSDALADGTFALVHMSGLPIAFVD